MGLTLEGATKEEITELDRLLSVMADMRPPTTDLGEREGVRERETERVGERGRERERERERVKEGREEEKAATWGTTIAGVSKPHTCKCRYIHICYAHHVLVN